MRYYVRGRTRERGPLVMLSGPYDNLESANHDAMTFRTKGYFDVSVSKGTLARRRLRDDRRRERS